MTGARVGSALTDEQRAVRDLVREFAADEVRPTAREADETGAFPEDVWDGLAELGLAGLTVPEEYGGFDADETTYAVVNEELAHGSLAVATALSVHCLVTACLAEFATEPQRERWLPAMAEGRPVGAFCLSEPHAGSNPAAMATTAEHDPEADEYVLNGEKQWITNGSRAGVAVVFAKVDPDDPDSITQFLVPTDAEGFAVGPKEEKLGLRASDTTPITFDGCRVPAANRLTPEGRGLAAALEVLTGGRIGIAAQAVGVARAALEAAREYATEREGFGDRLSEVQSVRHKVAEMSTDVAAARLLVREAARKAEAGEDARVDAARAKYRASEVAMSTTNEAVQIHGGYGYTREYDVERFYRDAKVTEIYEGTTEIQKEVIARGVFDTR
ncbi:acyl-CoA dehydrogenase family protein [Halorubrum rubrum]|uniref:Acyl-CoA dehydrogenase family protein n=1 Tax=Halorubrum rubrum TaxID=1126240 RepID=A0ABD5QZD6_9EURY|nr:acyl-CoA dehydrogenase family protein [Halorubrum rubrum]